MKLHFLTLPLAGFALAALLGLNAEAARNNNDEPSGNEYKSKDGFVVHEWGVIETKIKNGAYVNSSNTDELPAYVQDLGEKFPIRDNDWGDIKAEKPIIYFYGDKGSKFSVEINCSRGAPTKAWPHCEAGVESLQAAGNKDIEVERMKELEERIRGEKDREKIKELEKRIIEEKIKVEDLRGRIGRGGAKWNLLWRDVEITGNQSIKDWEKTDEAHWISKARDVHAPGIQVGKTKEKFLFYEGNIANIYPMLNLSVGKEQTSYEYYGGHDIYDVFIIKVDDGKIRYHFVDKIENASARKKRLESDKEMAEKPRERALTQIKNEDWKDGGKVSDMRDLLAEKLEAAGLYTKEARGMADIWSERFFSTDGIRAVYRLSQAEYDEIYPMTLTVKADKIVRVMLQCVDAIQPGK